MQGKTMIWKCVCRRRTFNAFYPEHVPGLGWYGGRVAQVKDDRCILYQPGYRGEGLGGSC